MDEIEMRVAVAAQTGELVKVVVAPGSVFERSVEYAVVRSVSSYRLVEVTSVRSGLGRLR